MHYLNLILIFLLPLSRASAQSMLSLADAIAAADATSMEKQQADLANKLADLETQLVEFDDDPRILLSASAGSRWVRPMENKKSDTKNISREAVSSTQLTYTLYDFGRHQAKQARAESGQKLATSRREETQEQIFWEVTRAYFAVTATTRLSKITKDQLAVNQTRLLQQKRNYKSGLRSESDVLMAEVDFGKSRIAFQQATLDAEAAKLKLSSLLNANAQASTDQPKEFEVFTDGVSTQDPVAWNKVLEQLNQPSSFASDKQINIELERLNADRDLITAEAKPILSASISAQYSNTKDTTFTPLHPSASGKLTLSWDLPWNGIHRAESEVISLKKQNLELQLAIDQRERRRRAEQALQKLEAAKTHHQMLENQINLARKQQKLVNDRYMAGTASSLELSAAESALLSVLLDRTKLSNFVADALLELAQARGVRDSKILSNI